MPASPELVVRTITEVLRKAAAGKGTTDEAEVIEALGALVPCIPRRGSAESVWKR